MRPSASIQCRPTLAFSKKSLSSSSLARSVCSVWRRSETSRNTSTLPATVPSAARTGAALSSIGHSVPSRPIRMVWLARPTIAPSRSARRAGLSTGCRVSSLTMRKISSSARPLRGVARPAGEVLGDRVQRDDPGRGVGHDDAVADRLQRGAQPLGFEAMAFTRAAQRVGAGADQPAGGGEDQDADDVRGLEPDGLDARDEEEAGGDGGAQRRWPAGRAAARRTRRPP